MCESKRSYVSKDRIRICRKNIQSIYTKYIHEIYARKNVQSIYTKGIKHIIQHLYKEIFTKTNFRKIKKNKVTIKNKLE